MPKKGRAHLFKLEIKDAFEERQSAKEMGFTLENLDYSKVSLVFVGVKHLGVFCSNFELFLNACMDTEGGKHAQRSGDITVFVNNLICCS